MYNSTPEVRRGDFLTLFVINCMETGGQLLIYKDINQQKSPEELMEGNR